jgi:serine/threonine-protein kinase
MAESTSAPPVTIGQVLGHYRLIEQIGAGGMGVVFRAHDEKLRRDVAVKILPHSVFSDPGRREQFHKEALAVGRLNHPNIGMAFDFGQDSDLDYLVTEYIPGINLDEKIGGQPLPLSTALDLGIQMLGGLAAAHRQQVLHRDLKPGNIRLTGDGRLKILDFGLAQLLEPVDETAETSNITDSELSVIGTLPYMAPELLRAESANESTDIWAAGAVLYEMAAGKRAFPDKQPSLIIDAILHYDPVRPSLLNPKLSPAFEAVILRALERDRELRYRSADEMCSDLNRMAAGDQIATDTLRRSTVVQLTRKRRRRVAIVGLAAILFAGVAIGYVADRFWMPHQKILAVLPIDTVGQDSATNALGMGLMETLTAKLVEASASDSIQVVSSRDLRDQGVKTAEDARREFGSDLVLESSLQRDGSTIRVNSYLVDAKTHRQLAARTITVDANDSFGLQDRVVSEALDMLPARIGPAERQKLAVRQDTKPAAYEAYIRGRGYLVEFNKPEDIDNAIAEFAQAVKIDPSYALGFAALGNTYTKGFRSFYRGTDWVDKASRNCEKALSLNPGLVEGYICLGNLYNGTGKYDKAVQEFQRAVQTEPGNEDVLRGLAEAYTATGNPAGAESAYKQAAALRANYWAVHGWLGKFYFDQNRYAEAAAEFQKETALAPGNYLAFSNLASVYVAQSRYPDAISAFNRSISLRPSADAYGDLGYTYTLMKLYPDAIAALQKALKLDDHDYMTWGNLADALYWSPNRRSEAAANYRKAIAIATSQVSINPEDAPTLAYLGNYNAMLDDQKSAYSYTEQALKLAPSDGEVLFLAAVVYNHFNQREQALSYLGKTVQAGYSRNLIRDTENFSNLQQDPKFRSIVNNP